MFAAKRLPALLKNINRSISNRKVKEYLPDDNSFSIIEYAENFIIFCSSLKNKPFLVRIIGKKDEIYQKKRKEILC